MCHLDIAIFQKSITLEKRVLLFHLFISNQTPLPFFSILCLCPTLLKASVIEVGGEQNRPASMDNPCSIFYGVDLVLFSKGEGVFSMGEGVF